MFLKLQRQNYIHYYHFRTQSLPLLSISAVFAEKGFFIHIFFCKFALKTMTQLKLNAFAYIQRMCNSLPAKANVTADSY